MKRRAGLAVLAAGLLVVACRTAVDLEPSSPAEVDVPAQWTALTAPEEREQASDQTPADQPPEADWWNVLADPQLDALVREALEQNWSLTAAAARVDAALSQARIAGAALQPQVGLALDGSRAKRNFIGFPIPGREDEVLAVTATTLSLGLSASWEVDLWGRLRASKAAAALDAAASREELEAARLSLSGQVVKAYVTLLEAQQQVALAESTFSSRRLTERRVRARYERGVSPSVELRLALTQVANVEATLAVRRRALDQVCRQLELLVGRYPAAAIAAGRSGADGADDGADAADAEALPEPPRAIPPGLPAELLLRRPDLRAAHRRALASAERVQAARAALYPRLSLTGSTGTASKELEDLVGGDFSIWSLAAGLLQPLFQGGRLRAGVSLAAAGEDEALARFVGATLDAFAEVETALVAERRLTEQVEALEQATAQSRAAAGLALDRYAAGLGDYLGVLESERQAFLAESALLETRRSRVTAWVDLVLALGGDLQPTPSTADAGTVPRSADAAP